MANHADQLHTSQSGPVSGFRFDVMDCNVIHGRGVVTGEEIPRGALILEEAPFFQLGSNEFIIPQSVRSHQRWQTLPPSSSPPSSRGGHYDKFKANALRCGRFRIASSTAEDDVSCLFEEASRFNSSCAPNLHAHWTGNKMQFRAVRKIPPGEELCVCYDVTALLFAKLDRQRLLLNGYGFVCQCTACSKADTSHSDLRRGGSRHIVERGVQNAQDVIDRTRKVLRDLRDDGVYHFGDTLHYDLYQVLWRAGDRTNAMHCLHAARNLACVMVGADDPRVTQMTAALPDNMREDYISDSCLLR